MSFEDYLDAERARGERPAALQRLQNLHASMLDIRRALDRDIEAAQSADPRDGAGQPIYTPAGLAAHRAELVAKVRADAAPLFEKLQRDVRADAELLRSHAEAVRPRIGEDAGSQMRVQRKWDQARMRLDAGMSLHTVIASTDDVDTLLGIAEWAPTYLEAQNYRAPGLDGTAPFAVDRVALQRTLDERLAAVADTSVADALTAARQAELAFAGFEQRAQHLADRTDDNARPVSDLESAIGAHLAEQQAQVGLEAEDLAAAEPAEVA